MATQENVRGLGPIRIEGLDNKAGLKLFGKVSIEELKPLDWLEVTIPVPGRDTPFDWKVRFNFTEIVREIGFIQVGHRPISEVVIKWAKSLSWSGGDDRIVVRNHDQAPGPRDVRPLYRIKPLDLPADTIEAAKRILGLEEV